MSKIEKYFGVEETKIKKVKNQHKVKAQNLVREASKLYSCGQLS